MVVEKKDKEIDFDVAYVPETEMEASQAAQDCGDATSQELIPETQTQVIPETQDIHKSYLRHKSIVLIKLHSSFMK